MHSFIIQLEEDPRNIRDNTSMSYDDEEFILNDFADYVDKLDGADRQRGIDCFLKSFDPSLADNMVTTEDAITGYRFSGEALSFLAARYERFHELAKKVSAMIFADYCEGFSNDWYNMCDEYTGRFDIYVCCSKLGILTLTQFARHVHSGETWYTGWVYDYHF